MNEIEVKVIEVEKNKAVRALIKLGAKKVAQGKQHTTAFDFPDCRLKKNKKMLRLREFSGRTFLTFKKLLSDDAARKSQELEIDVSDIKVAEAVLLQLGLQKSEGFTCYREKYKIGSTLFEFQKYKGIPEYMEIEARSQRKITEYVKKLKINKDKVKTWGGREMRKYYGKPKS